MHRRTFLLAAVATPSLLALLAGCGDPGVDPGDTTPGTGSVPPSSSGTPESSPTQQIAYPTGAGDIVVRVARVGGFVPAGAAFVEVPDLLITGDGRLFQPGVQTMQFPGPLLPAISLGSITPTGIGRLLAVAQANELLSEPVPEYVPDARVADAPATVVELQAGGVHVTHAADALGLAADVDGDPAKEISPARARLLTFVEAAGDLVATVGADELGPTDIWRPTAFRIQATTAEPPTTGTTDGEPGPTIVAWPAGTGVRLADAADCAIGTGDVLAATLGEATTLTFFTDDGITYQVSAVGQLPGTGC